MTRFFGIICLFSLFFLGGCAWFSPHQKKEQAVYPPDTFLMKVKVGKEKELKDVTFQLDRQNAPQTVDNFEKLVKRHYYNGMSFHRIFPDQLVQTGDPNSRRGETERSGTGGPGYTLPAEISLKHHRGSLAASRLPDTINPNRRSNGSQFYICLKEMPQLDGEYTVFGRVTQGMEQLDEVSKIPKNRNNYPLTPIKVISIEQL